MSFEIDQLKTNERPKSWSRRDLRWLKVTIAGLLLFGAVTSINCNALTVREALGMIESGNNDRAVGRAGEISRYQIKKNVWRKYSSSSRYSDMDHAWQVAEQVFSIRVDEFQRSTGRSPDSFELYVLWNAPGQFRAAGYKRSRISKVVAERAERFANLVGAKAPPVLAIRGPTLPTGLRINGFSDALLSA
ncbi:MAG: hypothetical protein DME18_16820 [Verrucomicrobia bacterium]|nr:MAG: hypothetical protein DME18_16820 [Verrucomicrobiota bacterium]